MKSFRIATLCVLGAITGLCAMPVFASETTSYSYDALGRLVGSSVSGGPNNGVGVTTTYDAAGNRKTYVLSGGRVAANADAQKTVMLAARK